MKLLKNSVKVVLTDGAYIRGLSQEQIDQIEQELTFKNPQYENVMKYSKWSTTKVPQYLSYFQHIEVLGKDIFRVPLGYFNAKQLGIPENYIFDKRTYEEVEYPEFKLELRDTQREAMESYLKHCESKNSITSNIQLPTGKGKTVLGLALAHRLKAKTLVIVHKDDLVRGWKEDIAKCFDNVDVGLIKAKSRSIGKHITIATIQTLNHFKPKELSALYEEFGFVILDECHHVPSTTFSLVENFKARYRLGLSATPERNDGLTHVIKLFFGGFCYTYSSKHNDTDIIPFEVIKRDVPIYYNPICKYVESRKFYSLKPLDYSNNYNPNYELSDNEYRYGNLPVLSRPKISYSAMDINVLGREEVIDFIINDIVTEYSKGHSCIVFFKQVAALLRYNEALIDYGVDENDIGLYYGGNKQCDEVIKKAESQRQYITLATYSKATEGTNVQQWEVAFFVSSLNNGKDVEQAVGRVRRTKQEGEKLSKALIYDYRYNDVYGLQRHGQTRDIRYRKLLRNKAKFSRGF